MSPGKKLINNPNADERFDASQYAFFGRDVTQEVEIGGLEEEEEVEPLDPPEDGEDSFSLPGGREEMENYGSTSDLSDISELTMSFMKLNSRISRSEGEAGSIDNLEAVSVANVSEGVGVSQSNELGSSPTWLDHSSQEIEGARGSRKWSHQQGVPVQEVDGSMGPSVHHIQQQWWGVEPSSAQVTSPVGAIYSSGRSQVLQPVLQPGQVQMMRGPAAQASPVSLPGPYRQPFPSLQPPVGVLPSMLPYGSVLPQYSPAGPLLTQLAPPGQWLAQPNVPISVPGTVPQIPQHTSLMPPQVLLQYQRPHQPQMHIVPPTYPHGQPQHLYNITPPATQMLQKLGENLIAGDFINHPPYRLRPPSQRHHQQHTQPEASYTGRNTHTGWQPLKSKYMTVEEIENIVRIQWAATHGTDPYVDDYYHQAVQAKVALSSPHGRRHFAPSHLRDLPSHTRATVEPHAYLQVDALGRVPFSSIRRPRPLLEVDSVTTSNGMAGIGHGESMVDGVPQHRPLEQEPMLAARIAIEDGLCLLLDVDDIDRLLAVSQPPDGGSQLRRRRQLLLEGLGASLQLADASNGIGEGGRGVNGRFVGHSAKDDLVFLRLVSLPKGRKLLTRYLQLLTPGSELVRVVAMAVFRHLRFLFGGVQSDASTTATSTGLANAAAVSVLSMDLPALSACLAAVVLAAEQPPLRPMGSPAGDGATVVLRAVLERATNLLTDRNAGYPIQNRAIWQASFDAFFSLLAKYCTNKYDSIFHSLMMASPGNAAAINTAAAAAMSKEMPVELLRASLPHTNDHQRKLLLEFTQRSMAMGAFPPNAGNDGHANMAAVRG